MDTVNASLGTLIPRLPRNSRSQLDLARPIEGGELLARFRYPARASGRTVHASAPFQSIGVLPALGSSRTMLRYHVIYFGHVDDQQRQRVGGTQPTRYVPASRLQLSTSRSWATCRSWRVPLPLCRARSPFRRRNGARPVAAVGIQLVATGMACAMGAEQDYRVPCACQCRQGDLQV